MSTRSIFEINHDFAGEIARYPEEFIEALTRYLNSASAEAAEELRCFGMARSWTGHHSDQRKVVTRYNEVKL
jgi:hypothetical protein